MHGDEVLTKNKDYEWMDEMVREEAEKPRGDLHCPECGSHRLYYFVGLRAGQIFVCKDCGYQGPVVIEDGKISEEIRKDWIGRRKD